MPVLIFHHVKLLKPSDDAIERGLTILPREFRAEIAYLRSHRYHAISAAQLVHHLRSGGALPAKPVVLTFDDGYTDIYSDVYPVLRRNHMIATFFIVPGFLNTPRYLTWKQVRTMSRHRMDIEAHSMTHPVLTNLNASGIWQQVWGSRHVLQQHLHRSVRVFAYPYGNYDSRVLAALRAAGFYGAFTTLEGWSPSTPNLLHLPRVYVDLDDTIPIFAGRLRDDPKVLAQDPT
ncbi:MAG: polysaccharide deacetylase family protein [Chloroflexota bacterium]